MQDSRTTVAIFKAVEVCQMNAVLLNNGELPLIKVAVFVSILVSKAVNKLNYLGFSVYCWLKIYNKKSILIRGKQKLIIFSL